MSKIAVSDAYVHFANARAEILADTTAKLDKALDKAKGQDRFKILGEMSEKLLAASEAFDKELHNANKRGPRPKKDKK